MITILTAKEKLIFKHAVYARVLDNGALEVHSHVDQLKKTKVMFAHGHWLVVEVDETEKS